MAFALSFIFFIMLMVVIGNIPTMRKKQHSSEDYLMAGRSHGKFMIALSAAASAATGFVMIAAVGAGYTMGLMAVLMPLGWFFGDFLFWTLFPSRINQRARDSNCNTIPEFISDYTSNNRNTAVRKCLAIAIIAFVGLFAVGQFLAVGKAINAVFDLSMTSAIIVSGLIILAYSAKGGLESSIPTQFFQALVMLMATTGMFVLAIILGDGPVQIIKSIQSVDPDLLSIDGGQGLWVAFLLFIGWFSAAFVFDLGTPYLLVRIMAAKSPEESAKSRWIYLGFMQVTWVSMTLFGVLMNVFLPGITDPEQALPLFVGEYLHPIVSGAVMAGIFAAVASSLDGQLLVVSSSFAVDISPVFCTRMTKRYGLRYQATVTIIVSIIMGLIAIVLQESTNVFNLVVISASAMAGTIGLAFFITIMRWRTTPSAIIFGFIAAILTSLGWRYYGLSEYMIEGTPSFIAGLITHQLIVTFIKRIPTSVVGKVPLSKQVK